MGGVDKLQLEAPKGKPMTIRQFFKDLFADEPEPLLIIFPKIDAVYASGQIPMMARITIGQGHGQYIMLPIPSTSGREDAYDALQAHYGAQYGEHVKITVEHLCSSPEDPDEGTVRHSAAVTAQCEHGLSMRVCTVDVVTNRETNR